jgi:hypothetical protein
MAASRLSDSQKLELVERFRAGESSQGLADAFACSPNTVSRVVKAAMAPADYELLKRQRARRGARPETAPAAVTAPEPVAPDPAPEPLPAPEPAPAPPAPPEAVEVPVATADDDADGPDDADAPEDDDAAITLAIDDADDFGADEDDDLEAVGDGDDGDDPDEHDPFRPIALAGLVDDLPLCEVRPLTGADLPASAWMLVDKVVELQPKPLREFPELGRLPDGELDRQAIAVYANPRQAKRHCGRTQRVIKVPDLAVLELTSRYLVAQGISRLVVEGALYSLPGS